VAHGTTPIGSRREAKYLLFMLGIPNPYASAEAINGFSEGTIAAMSETVLCRGPLNWLGEADVRSEAIRNVYSDESHARLTATKQSVDPQNRFRFSGIGVVD
jgi:hypothetical protein